MYIAILLRLILGYVIVEVEGYYIERFINICQNKKILIWNIKREKGVKLSAQILTVPSRRQTVRGRIEGRKS